VAAVKALTVQQPWAWAIAKGYKLIENRTWSTPHRGPLAIHAGKTWDQDSIPEVLHRLREHGIRTPQTFKDELPLAGVGAVIASADLVSICLESYRWPRRGLSTVCQCGDWAAGGQYHWQLANVRALAEPVPAKGRLGLWDIDLAENLHEVM
jgi:hypothetical protein